MMQPTVPYMVTTRPSSDPISPPPPDSGRWWFVYGSIIAAFVLFFAFVALLYWNWLSVDEPSAVIVIPRGTPERAGFVVQVEGYNLDQPLILELVEENHYGGRIYLTPGVYTLKIIRDGEIEYAAERTLLEFQQITLRLEHGIELQESP